ncbi:MAG: TetR/AcrR family transcriptional regulator [Actinomyces sp.]|nr:MAG: TetR/AcrR family transcriptional regulator [Actinomyces sp.]
MVSDFGETLHHMAAPVVGKSARTRARLVAATRAAIRARGTFTAADVAARAEVVPATFYAHFASRGDALAAAFAATLDEVVDLVGAHLDPARLDPARPDRGAPAVLAAFVDALVDFFAREARVFRAALGDLATNPGVRATYRAHEESAMAHLVPFVAAVRGTGPDDPAVVPVARALLVAGQGLDNPLLFTGEHSDAERAVLVAGLCALVTADPRTPPSPRRPPGRPA